MPGLDPVAYVGALRVTRARHEQDARLLEQLTHGGGADFIREHPVVLVHRPAGKDVGTRGKVGATWPLHHQQLPRIITSNQQHRGRWTRGDGRSFVDRGRWQHLIRMREAWTSALGARSRSSRARRKVSVSASRRLWRGRARVFPSWRGPRPTW